MGDSCNLPSDELNRDAELVGVKYIKRLIDKHHLCKLWEVNVRPMHRPNHKGDDVLKVAHLQP
jgi:hypothetical protein